MNTMIRIALGLYIILLLFPINGNADLGQPRNQSRRSLPAYRPHELIVQYKPGAVRKHAHKIRRRLSAETVRSLDLIQAEHIRLPHDVTVEEALEALRDDPDILAAEPNYLRRAMAVAPPDDPFFAELWSLQNTGQTVNGSAGTPGSDIQALDAWETTTDCSNVVIAIIDSGIDLNHPDLKNNLWTNPGEIAGNGIDDDGNGYVDDIHGWNFVDDNNDVSDSNDHGTHVAGIIGSQGNNAVGATGVCWNAKLMILKFLDHSGTGSASDEIDAIEYAVANNAKIINASFGESGYLTSEQQAIAAAGNAGLLFVASSGNQGFDNASKARDDRIYPGAYDTAAIINVAASDPDDQLPDWSVYGAVSVDLAAPGTDIYAAFTNRSRIWSSDFDTGLDGWALTGTWGRVAASPAYLADSPSADYTPNAETTAISPRIDELADHHAAILTFSIRGRSETGARLYLETATSGIGPWTGQAIVVTAPSGNSTRYTDGLSGSYSFWSDAAAMLTGLDNQAAAYIRFRFHVDSTSSGDDGWEIDDIAIHAVHSQYPAPESDHYQFLSGTSAAAPFVAGAAGLLWSRTPGLSNTQIKNALINGVDPLAALDGKVVSGGRLNLAGSLQLSLDETVTSGSTAATGDDDSSACFAGSLLP